MFTENPALQEYFVYKQVYVLPSFIIAILFYAKMSQFTPKQQ